MYKTIQNSTPWLILAGSGGVADILVTLINQACWDADIVQELLIDTFPNGQSGAVTSWIKLVRAKCITKKQQNALTFVFALTKLVLHFTNEFSNFVGFFLLDSENYG